ncbi:MAG: hypothetical protein WBC91_26225, partial [Phototrophicaceae bacterium]
MIDVIARFGFALLGCWLIYVTVLTTIRVFVLPRGENAWLSRQIFRFVYQLFLLAAYKKETFNERDAILALFAPVVLLVQPMIYLSLIIIGFTPIYWVLSSDPLTLFSFEEAFFLSGSSLMTLGFAPVGAHNIPTQIFSFTQAAMGMMFVALLIAYLPTIYSAFSTRESLVAMLEVRAGTPPSGIMLLERTYRNGGDREVLNTVWTRWEEWFAQIEESHTSLVALVFFRSPMPDRHWVTAAGAILDAASLLDAVVDEPRSTESVMCIRAGYVSLRRIADFFGTVIPYDPNPSADDPISITREEFDEAYDELRDAGIAVVKDRDAAWRNFRGWRVNYDRVLLGLARITSAPYAPWSSDRTMPDMKNIPGIEPSYTFDYRP